MAAAAAKLYEKFVSRDAALDYVEMVRKGRVVVAIALIGESCRMICIALEE